MRVEEALRERVSTVNSIIRAAPVVIGPVPDRVLLQVNARISEMMGYMKAELIGQNARILYPTEERVRARGAG